MHYVHRLVIYYPILRSVLIFLMNVDDFLYFVITTHEDSRTIVNMFRDHGEHTFHMTVDRLTAS